MLTTTTHNKLRDALDGTDTQVATCAIDRWTAKMKRTEGYITREISRRRGTTIWKTQGSSIGGVSEEEKKKSSSAEDRGRALTFPPTTLLMIQFPNDPARPLKESSQRSSSQGRFSTKFIVLGLLGLGLLTSTVKGTPPNRDPTISAGCGKNLYASKNDKLNRAEPNTQEGMMMANLLDREWRTAEGFPA